MDPTNKNRIGVDTGNSIDLSNPVSKLQKKSSNTNEKVNEVSKQIQSNIGELGNHQFDETPKALVILERKNSKQDLDKSDSLQIANDANSDGSVENENSVNNSYTIENEVDEEDKSNVVEEALDVDELMRSLLGLGEEIYNEEAAENNIASAESIEEKAAAKEAVNVSQYIDETAFNEIQNLTLQEAEEFLRDVKTVVFENGSHCRLVSLLDLTHDELQNAINKNNLIKVVNGELKAHPKAGYNLGQILPVMDNDGNIQHIRIAGFLTKEESNQIVTVLEEYKKLKFTPNPNVQNIVPRKEIIEEKKEHIDVNEQILTKNLASQQQIVQKNEKKTEFQFIQLGKVIIEKQEGGKNERAKEKADERKLEKKKENDASWKARDISQEELGKVRNAGEDVRKEREEIRVHSEVVEKEQENSIVEERPLIPTTEAPKPSRPKDPPRETRRKKKHIE